jgi:hypothetical protein
VEAERYIEVLVVRHCDNAEVPLLPVVGKHAVRCEAVVRRGNAAEVSTKAGSINNIPHLTLSLTVCRTYGQYCLPTVSDILES